MKYRVIFSPEAEEQLAALYNHIADAATPDIAERYARAIITYCESMTTFPIRGIMREDVRPGLRITNYTKRLVIAFAVDTNAGQVSILGLFYGGQDYEAILLDEFENNSDREKENNINKKIPLRFWRISINEFDELERYLNNWSQKNIQILKSITVFSELQSVVAARHKVSSQNVNAILKRGFRIHEQVNDWKSKLIFPK